MCMCLCILYIYIQYIHVCKRKLNKKRKPPVNLLYTSTYKLYKNYKSCIHVYIHSSYPYNFLACFGWKHRPSRGALRAWRCALRACGTKSKITRTTPGSIGCGTRAPSAPERCCDGGDGAFMMVEIYRYLRY